MRIAHFALGIGLLGVGGHMGMTESLGAGSLSSRNQVFVSVPGRPVTANRCKVGIVARSERNSARHHVLVLIFKNTVRIAKYLTPKESKKTLIKC